MSFLFRMFDGSVSCYSLKLNLELKDLSFDLYFFDEFII